MRELIFVPVVMILCLAGVVKAEIGMSAYLWYGLMRPDIFAFVDNKYPVSLAFAIVAGLSSIFGGIADLSRCLFANPLVRWLFLLQIPIAISVVFAVSSELSVQRYGFYIRVVLVVILLPLAIRTEQHMHMAFLTMACSLGILGVKFGLYGLIHGGVDLGAQGWGEMLADNNFFALAMATNLALCWYGRSLTSSKLFKLVLLGMFACSLAAIVMSNSRGSVIAAAVGMLLIIARSRYKALSLLVITAMMAGSVFLVKDMFFARMSTLTSNTPEASAESRLEHAKIAIKMWHDHPLIGVGFGGLNYARLVRFYTNRAESGLNEHVAHNSYLQMLVDCGPVGFLIYAGQILYAIRWLGKTSKRQRQKDAPDARLAITRGLQVSLIIFAIGSTFYSANRMDLLYMLLMMTAAWYAIHTQQVESERESHQEASTEISTGYARPLRRAPGGFRPAAITPIFRRFGDGDRSSGGPLALPGGSRSLTNPGGHRGNSNREPPSA